MRLSQWRAAAPSRESMSAKVLAVAEPVLASLGAASDPECWVAWGDDPGRYTILAPTPPGLVICAVRVNQAGEGPRAAAKLARWNRIQVGELAVETHAGRRMMSFQVEGVILRGVGDDADRIGAFAVSLFAAMDGRPAPEPAPTPTSSAKGSSTPRRTTRRTAATRSA